MNLFSLRSNCEISPPPDLSLILTAQCLQDICVSEGCSRMLESMEGLQVSQLAGLHNSARHGQGGSGARRQAALAWPSCVYVVTAKSWWEIGKNDRL